MNKTSHLRELNTNDIERKAVLSLCSCTDPDDEQYSPSKNYKLCPWLETTHNLNQVYSKKPPPTPSASHHSGKRQQTSRISHIGLKSERYSRHNDSKLISAATSTKTVDMQHMPLKIVAPLMELNRQVCVTTMAQNTEHAYKNTVKKPPKAERIVIKWKDFQSSTDKFSNNQCTLPNILKDNFLKMFPSISRASAQRVIPDEVKENVERTRSYKEKRPILLENYRKVFMDM